MLRKRPKKAYLNPRRNPSTRLCLNRTESASKIISNEFIFIVSS